MLKYLGVERNESLSLLINLGVDRLLIEFTFGELNGMMKEFLEMESLL